MGTLEGRMCFTKQPKGGEAARNIEDENEILRKHQKQFLVAAWNHRFLRALLQREWLLRRHVRTKGRVHLTMGQRAPRVTSIRGSRNLVVVTKSRPIMQQVVKGERLGKQRASQTESKSETERHY